MTEKQEKPLLAVERQTLKLDLGSADRPKEGFDSVDLYHPLAKYKIDLFKFPFPWADESVDEIHCSHFLEHIPAREIEERDLSDKELGKKYLDWDMLFCFMSECWRILIPEGTMTIVVPSARSDRAFQDPTHRRFINEATFLYFNQEWRKINGLEHYQVKCNFGISVNPVIPSELALLHPEAQARRFKENWNTTYDFHAVLVKKPLSQVLADSDILLEGS